MEMVPEFHRVAPLSEISDGSVKQYKVGEKDVLVAKIEGKVYATAAMCTHEAMSLETGILSGGTNLMCSSHFAIFDLATGAVVGEPDIGEATPLQTFAVKVVDDWIYIAA